MDPVFMPLANSRVPPGSKLSTYLDRTSIRDSCDMMNGVNGSAGFMSGSRIAAAGGYLSGRMSQPPALCRTLSQPPSAPPPSLPLSVLSSQHQLPPPVTANSRHMFRQDSGSSASSMFFHKAECSDMSSVSSVSPPTLLADTASIPPPPVHLPPSSSTQQQLHRHAPPALPPNFVTPPPSSLQAVPPSKSATSTPASAGVVNMSRPYVPNEARDLLLAQQASVETHPVPDMYPDLPAELDNYHELCPLEPPNHPLKSATFAGVLTTCFKATNMKTGQRVCLRRVHGQRLSSTKALQMVHLWKRLNHTNLVSLRELFTTKCFGDNSVVFVYDFYAGVETLISRHFSRSACRSSSAGSASLHLPSSLSSTSSASTTPGHQDRFQHGWTSSGRSASALNDKPSITNGLIAESLLWSYIIQLTSVLRAIHSAGLACRVLDPSKVLVSGADRIHLNGCGVLDILLFDSSSMSNNMDAMTHYQLEDLLNLGKLLLVLACNSLLAIQRDSINTSISIVERHYSADLKNLIVNLLMSSSGSGSAGCRSIGDVMPLIGARFYLQLDASMRLSDRLFDELQQTCVASHLFKLLTKLTVLSERNPSDGGRGRFNRRAKDLSFQCSASLRSSFTPDATAGSTDGPDNDQADDLAENDCVLLGLFRHYLFHTLTDTDQPYLCLSHCVSALNKLEAGCEEKICLMSGDTETVMVVSYAELRQAFERAQYRLLPQASNPVTSSIMPGVTSHFASMPPAFFNGHIM